MNKNTKIYKRNVRALACAEDRRKYAKRLGICVMSFIIMPVALFLGYRYAVFRELHLSYHQSSCQMSACYTSTELWRRIDILTDALRKMGYVCRSDVRETDCVRMPYYVRYTNGKGHVLHLRFYRKRIELSVCESVYGARIERILYDERINGEIVRSNKEVEKECKKVVKMIHELLG